MAKVKFSLDYLSQRLAYRAKTGEFTWLDGKRVGLRAGNLKRDGYRKICIGSQKVPILEHRIAWLFAYDCWPTGDLDHINGVRSDNRIINLRPATRSQNLQNSVTRGLIPYRGVRLDRARYVACIRYGGRQRRLGTSNSAVLCALLYDEAARKHFGEYARTNFK